MATTNGNRKILDLKRWEFCTPSPAATTNASFVVSSRHYGQQQLLVSNATVAYLYNPSEDGFVQLPSPALAGTFGAGACGVSGSFSTGTAVAASSLTATAGSTTSITTNQTLARDLRGYSVYFVGGTNSGKLKTIASNTVGTNAVITFTDAEAVAFDATSVFRLKTPVFYVLGAGTLAANIFKKYDWATNTWTTLVQTGLPATIGVDSRLVSTPAWIDSGFQSFATGTATSGATTTLTNSAKAWTVNQWTNYQIRITAGTGAGQIRYVVGNTATVLSVNLTWAVTPDATSQYSLEGNDDNLYYMGSSTTTLYKYMISNNSWSTVTPTAARTVAPGAGMSADWVHSVSAADWNVENTIQNGRYIYSFRAGGAIQIDRYDIALNTWASAITYSPGVETFAAGTKYVYSGDYIYAQKEVTGRWLRYDIARASMDGWSTMTYTQGLALVGDTAFDVTYSDGAVDITYIYMILNTSAVMLRQMVI